MGASVVFSEAAGSSKPSSVFAQLVGGLAGARERVRVAALDGASATFHAGSSTVVLAAPGAGSTTLLRLVSGRVAATPAGAVTWGGHTAAALAASGASIARLAGYCGEADEHESHLTVRETLAFAHTAGVVPSAPHSKGAFYAVPTPEDIVTAVGLTGAGDTIAGGMLARGLSGGERRRLSVAETLVLNRRVVCLDKPTDGLVSGGALRATWLARLRALRGPPAPPLPAPPPYPPPAPAPRRTPPPPSPS